MHAQIDGSLELVVAQIESLQVAQTVDILDRCYLVVRCHQLSQMIRESLEAVQFCQLVALEIDRVETRQADKVLHLLDHVVLQVDRKYLFLSLE